MNQSPPPAPAGASHPLLMPRDDAEAAPRYRLQELILPEAGLCTEHGLYVHLDGPAGLSQSRGEIVLDSGGTAGFDTYFNLFSLGKWTRRCGLEDLSLTLHGSGEIELTVVLARPERSWERLVNEVVTLDPESPACVDLSQFRQFGGRGSIYFEVTALSRASLTGAVWTTAQAPRRTPDLTLSITTFRREDAVARSAGRFARFVEGSPLAPHLHALVVDNGQSADLRARLPESPNLTLIGNANLGGAGGFARGLIEARARGASHCLFMDDDASIHMDSLVRTWTFLAYATDPATAVAGAMINAAHKWALWENGAIYDRRCIPLHIGTDLRDGAQVIALERETSGPAPAGFYGGWWYFAFPLDRVRHLPFPFFVRGDDVSFSLAHDFDTVTLNGVVSFQDGFTGKESPLTWYLDLRSHLAHHLSLPHMDVGWIGLWQICAWFYLRNLIRMHYETLAAINMAVEDVLAGPGFFEANADMAARRADLGAMRRDEAWGDAPAPPDRVRLDPQNPVTRMAMKATLNGHLLPFFSRLGNRIALPSEERGRVRAVWGAAALTVVNEDTGQSYTVTHSKRAAWREGWRLARNMLRLRRALPQLRADWQAGYDRLTREGFWTRALDLESHPASGRDRAVPDDAPAGQETSA